MNIILVKRAKKNEVKIIGLTGVLTFAIDSMKKTIDAFKEAGLGESCKYQSLTALYDNIKLLYKAVLLWK